MMILLTVSPAPRTTLLYWIKAGWLLPFFSPVCGNAGLNQKGNRLHGLLPHSRAAKPYGNSFSPFHTPATHKEKWPASTKTRLSPRMDHWAVRFRSGIIDQVSNQFYNICFRADIAEWVISVRLLHFHQVQHPYPVSMRFQHTSAAS